jgi:hypothetical protein
MIFGIFTVIFLYLGILSEFVNGQSDTNSSSVINENDTQKANQVRIDASTNPNFSFFNETSGLPSEWRDPLHNCEKYFSCTVKFTEGWNDYVSFSLSTSNNTNSTWSSIYGKPIEVISQQKYQLVTHMKLNKWATRSHIALEGFNQASNHWTQIKQCPPGMNGPLEWKEFSCVVTIPQNATMIRLVLNAGWSSEPNREATTWFDSVDMLGNERVAAAS